MHIWQNKFSTTSTVYTNLQGGHININVLVKMLSELHTLHTNVIDICSQYYRLLNHNTDTQTNLWCNANPAFI